MQREGSRKPKKIVAVLLLARLVKDKTSVKSGCSGADSFDAKKNWAAVRNKTGFCGRSTSRAFAGKLDSAS